MTIIDADAHVHECDRTWDFIPESDQQYRPFTVTGTVPGTDQPRDWWVVGGQLKPRGSGGNVGKATPKDATLAAGDESCASITPRLTSFTTRARP